MYFLASTVKMGLGHPLSLIMFEADGKVWLVEVALDIFSSGRLGIQSHYNLDCSFSFHTL